jgi:hypothetical protein
MDTPLTSARFPFDGRSITLAASLVVLMINAPHEALAKGGAFHLWTSWSQRTAVSQPEATTVSHTEATTVFGVLGGCGGKRYRDPNTHRCRGP